MRSLVFVAALLVASPTAGAAPVCADGGSKQKAHQAGVEQGKKLVEAAWKTLGRDCAERDHLEQTVRDALARLTPPGGSSDTVVCRYGGVEEGANTALADIAANCQGS
jgi:hypothetical protein